GIVYQAVQKSTRRKVAVKVLRDGHWADSGDRARFEREVQVLGQLKHPNIVGIHDSGVAAGHPFLVMDYIPGKPLDEYVQGLMDRGIEGSRPVALGWFARACEATAIQNPESKIQNRGGIAAVRDGVRGGSRGAPAWHHSPRYQAQQHPSGPRRAAARAGFRA